MPSLTVQTFPSRVHILDFPPYNHFLVTCTVWAEVEDERVPLAISIDWKKRVESQTNSGPRVQFFSITMSELEVNGSPTNGYIYQSMQQSHETDTENSITYRCRASFQLDADRRKTEIGDSHIAVVGKYT